MKRIPATRRRVTSVTMLTVAVLLIGSMAMREYAHIIDHIHRAHRHHGTFTSDLDHEAKFHYVTEAEPSYEPLCWHGSVAVVLQTLPGNPPFSQPHLLHETRAPPTFI